MKISSLTVLNIILATILTASLILTNSTNMSRSNSVNTNISNYEAMDTGEYDPWLDQNNDGKIDWFDIQLIKRSMNYITVTNFPLDEEGNIKVNSTYQDGSGTCTQTFPQILKLRGFIFPAMNPEGKFYTTGELFDEDDTYPKEYKTMVDNWYGNAYEWTLGYNGTFVYEKYPQKSYKIQGNIRINLYYTCDSTYSPYNGYWRGNLTLQKILPNSTKVLLATMYSFDTGEHDIVNETLIFPVPTPIAINEEERLAVVFLIEYKWWAAGGSCVIRHFFDPTTDEFLINIPIVP